MNPTIYNAIVLLVIITISGLLFQGVEEIDEAAMKNLRMEQILAARLDPGEAPLPLLQSGDVIIDDYFKAEGDVYRYLGGIPDAPWHVGTLYTSSDLLSRNISIEAAYRFFGQKLGEKSYYINIDRGDEKAPAAFLKTMDRRDEGTLDTLVIDFRFLRSVEFGAVLRLFNQIAPARKILLGTIIDLHQEENIMSSGRPFFTAKETVFLVHESTPASVRHLVARLSQLEPYTIAGTVGDLADTVCLFTPYTIGEDMYRICTEKWTSDLSEFHDNRSGTSKAPSEQIDLLRKTDEIWYKNRDTVAMVALAEEILMAYRN